VQWFWEILGSFSNDERILFMRFVSGRSRLPVNTADLSQRFQILKIDRVNMANVVRSCNHTHTRLTALFPGRPRWAGTRKGKTNLDFTGARDSEWQWHQQCYVQVCTSLLAPGRQPRQHRTTQFFYRPDAPPAAQPTASKH